jgi:hypothetical protein
VSVRFGVPAAVGAAFPQLARQYANGYGPECHDTGVQIMLFAGM